jgi:hypothetical protein
MRAAVLFCLCLIAAVALSQPIGRERSAEEREASALAHRLAVLRALNALELTGGQQQQLLTILRPRVADAMAIREAQVEAQPQVEQAMQSLRAAVLANNGVPDSVKAGVHRAQAPYKVPEKRLELRQPDDAAKVWALLTTAQGARLRRGLSDEFSVQTDAEWMQSVLPSITVPRNNVERALRWLYMGYGLRGEEIARAMAFGKPIVAKWQQQPALSPRQRQQFLRELVALPVKGVLSEQPERSTERAILYLLLTQQTLYYLTGEVPLPPFDSPETPALVATVNDIRVLNLTNSLYLTEEQITALAALERGAGEEYAGIEARRLALDRQALPMLRQLVAVPADPALQAQYAAYRKERVALLAEDARIDRRYLPQVKDLLTENQLAMVGNFIPCVVPVQSLTNPERIGQAVDNSGTERALERIRALPAARVPEAVERLQARVETAFKLKHYREEQFRDVLAQVPAVAAEARAMDETEFKLKKCDLAEQISVPERGPATGRALDGRLVQYLLSPNLIPILEKHVASNRNSA